MSPAAPFAARFHRLHLAVLGLCSATVVAAQSLPPSPASQSPKTPETLQLEAYVVTGTNIKRVDAETALPVVVIDREDMSLRFDSTMADFSETLTMADPAVISELQVDSQRARGDVNSVDLRGLGSGNTLTLVNGRRVAPFPVSMSENGIPSLAPNINAIPTALLNQVEVLPDGASAIYGTDAAAGVINNRTTRSFRGRTVTAKTALTQHGGGNEFRFTIAEGRLFGKTHVSVALDVFHRDALSATDRAWSRDSDLRNTRQLPAPWDGVPIVDPVTGVQQNRDNDFHNGSAVSAYGQWQRGFIQSDFRTFIGSRPAGNVGISTSAQPDGSVATMSTNGTFFLYPRAAGGLGFKTTAPSRSISGTGAFDPGERFHYLNVLKWRVLSPRTDRVNLAAFVDHPLTPRTSAFGDLMVYRAKSITGREPPNFDRDTEIGIYVPASNPWNPFGTRFYHPTGAPNADGTPRLTGTPADVSASGEILLGPSPRVIEVLSHQLRALAGLRGTLARDWKWESALMYSAAQTHEFEHNHARESRLREALGRTDNTAFNPFRTSFRIVNNQIVADQPYENPASVLGPILDTNERYAHTKLFTWDANLSGELWRLGRGGHVGFATGAELRWESYDDKRPVFHGLNPPGSQNLPFLRDNDDDFIALSPNRSLDSQRTVTSVFAETSLPFVGRENRLPLVQALELNLAGRHERFSIGGNTTKPKASLYWKPVSFLKLRSSYNESFRIPNLVQQNTQPVQRNGNANDPYRSEVTGLETDATGLRLSLKQGSEKLKPEQSKSWRAGLVLDVPKVRGLSLTFDYWAIRLRDVIEDIGIGGTLRTDEDILDRAVRDALAAGTPIDRIDLGSGTANYQGYENVVRAPVTQEDIDFYNAFNARQLTDATRRAPVGKVVRVINDYVNLSARERQGYEIGLQYRLPKFPLGQFTFKAEATRNTVRETQAQAGARPSYSLDRNGRPRWRANGTLTWRRDAWAAGWFTSYFGPYSDTSAATTDIIYNALGRPDYINVVNDAGTMRYWLRVEPVIMHNAYLAHQFRGDAPRWLRGVRARLGVNNVFDLEPPLADETYGYFGGSANTRGRQFTFELRRTF